MSLITPLQGAQTTRKRCWFVACTRISSQDMQNSCFSFHISHYSTRHDNNFLHLKQRANAKHILKTKNLYHTMYINYIRVTKRKRKWCWRLFYVLLHYTESFRKRRKGRKFPQRLQQKASPIDTIVPIYHLHLKTYFCFLITTLSASPLIGAKVYRKFICGNSEHINSDSLEKKC